METYNYTVYWQNKSNKQIYKMTLSSANMEYLDRMLDTIKPSKTDIISKEEFKRLSDDDMITIDIMNEDEDVKIGELTTKESYIEHIEDEEYII